MQPNSHKHTPFIISLCLAPSGRLHTSGQVLRYSPSGPTAGRDGAAADAIVKAVATSVAPTASLHVAPAGSGSTAGSNVLGYASAAAAAGAVVDGLHNGQPTWAVVHFQFDRSSNTTRYTIGLNQTSDYSGTWEGQDIATVPYLPTSAPSLSTVSLQIALDLAIAASPQAPGNTHPVTSASASLTFAALVRVMPSTAGQAQWALTSRLLSTVVVVVVAWCSTLVMREIGREKVSGVVASMRFMGLHEYVYWASWQGPVAIAALAAALVTPPLGALAGLTAFQNCDYFLWFAILWPLYLANAAFATLFVSAASSRCIAAVATVCFLVFTVVFHAFIVLLDALATPRPASAFGPSMWDKTYEPGVSMLLKILLNMLPVFHAGKVWDDVLKHTGPQPGGIHQAPHFSVGDGQWWASNQFVTTGVYWTSPSPGFSVLMLWLIYFLCVTAAWHRGRPSLGKGTSCSKRIEHECICLSPRAWARCCRHSRRTRRASSAAAATQGTEAPPISLSDIEAGEQDAEAAGGAAGANVLDRATAAQRASAADGSIRIVSMTKSYDTGTAVKELSLTMNAGEVFCLLGHNGAGQHTRLPRTSERVL